ncbi:MAG: 3'(2'),5'-bisphosphate nucleotidase [SAR86 cluster bacterium]|uniref:3'(2'),5'-bisphosphate nucleotidase CysQ n=1 Tax=SAR86 cluster bacterium TaxID=2030880 RepID=A0A2A5CIK6_9GAMM|nr:3'(2'),5'-bisphosphate nucleotidase CysQ [Gammaproteobacteria bacterium AH-315-E17]PCJ43709.1 MAG: 3'(2'),5'-bisphosphate nucleotidase [SAR86 cluster bacterium]
MLPSDLIDSVKKISREAGAAILEIYHREGSIEVTSKDDDSPLTEADLAAHKIIVSALSQLTPELPILSEESTNISWDERQAWSQYWLVDPLDGTKEFLKRNGEFTVNIALIDNHVPVLGAVYVPVNNILYSGVLGQGAFKENNGVEQEISVALTSEEVKIVASRSHRGSDLDAWIKKVEKYFRKVELLSMGSSLKICLVAEGKADIYPRLALTSEWDTAAAQAILEAAGGTLKDSEFNTYRYNQKENILNPFFFAIGDTNFDWQQF